MSKVYFCLHCRAQNFATNARFRLASRFPLHCWKCGKKITKKELGIASTRQRGSGRRKS